MSHRYAAPLTDLRLSANEFLCLKKFIERAGVRLCADGSDSGLRQMQPAPKMMPPPSKANSASDSSRSPGLRPVSLSLVSAKKLSVSKGDESRTNHLMSTNSVLDENNKLLSPI
jgi:hypothetical protein